MFDLPFAASANFTRENRAIIIFVIDAYSIKRFLRVQSYVSLRPTRENMGEKIVKARITLGLCAKAFGFIFLEI